MDRQILRMHVVRSKNALNIIPLEGATCNNKGGKYEEKEEEEDEEEEVGTESGKKEKRRMR